MLDLTDFAVQEQPEDNLMVAISRPWYNCSYTMAAKPIKSLELHYTMIQFLINIYIHLSSFKDPKKKNATELSKHIWRLKENNMEVTITWEMVARAKPYSNSNKKCNLCTTEKYFILCEPHRSSLNKRNELTSTCRHANAYLLKHA